MKAIHFGAGNIGRGFIGEILAKNSVEIVFVDMNTQIIDALNKNREYDISYALSDAECIYIKNVRGINNGLHPEAVIEEIVNADIITTAIGANVLQFIAPLIAKGLRMRMERENYRPLDIVACENMIGGSEALKAYVYSQLTVADIEKVDRYIGFPNAAVDRIVPVQSHADPLFVSVEPFSEWIIDKSNMKNQDLILEGVQYEESLAPYIERKLFSVNTGHAAVGYIANMLRYETVKDAISDERVLDQLQGVLEETGQLLVDKWGFDRDAHKIYQKTVIERFQNPHLSDDVSRIARTPIRKLGYNERFILPIRELKARNYPYDYLLDTVGMAFLYEDSNDEESKVLRKMLQKEDTRKVVQKVTGLKDIDLIGEIMASLEKHKEKVAN